MRKSRGIFVMIVLSLVLTIVGAAAFAAEAAWTVDTKNRAVRDGTPTFPRIAYDTHFDGGNGDDPVTHVTMRNLQNYGFNVYLNYYFGSLENALDQLPALPSSVAGMATGDAFQEHTVEEMGMNNGVQSFDLVNNPNNFRARFNAEPKAGGVYLADEPTIGVLSNVQTWAARYKADLPNQPRLVVLTPEGPLIPQDGENGDVGWIEWEQGHANPYWWARKGAGGDWLAEDPYTNFKAETTGPKGYYHFWVADRTAHTVAAAKQNGQVPITVLQLFTFTAQGRFPTINEMWSHVVMAVAEGARGLAWWQIGREGPGLAAQPDSIRIPTDAALKEITLLLRDLEPVILSDPNPSLLVGNSTTTGNAVSWRVGILDAVAAAIAPFNYLSAGRGSYVAERNALNAGITQWSPMLDQSGDVRTRVWEDASGNGYVFAYNYNPLQKDSVTLTWYRPLQSVQVLGENRTITPNGAAWTDAFGGSTSLNMAGRRIGHIYKLIPVGGGPGAPSVTFTNPSNGATVSGTITVSLSASGGSGTYNNYTVKLDGTTIYSGQGPSFSWNTTTATAGAHALTATVTDSSNVTSPATQINVTVSQGSGIAASITSPATGATVSGTVPVNMSVSGAAAGNKTFALSIDGVVKSTQTVAGTTASYNWDTTAYAAGSHTLSLTVTDSSNASNTTSITVTVSTGGGTPLTVDITQPTNGSTVSGTNWVIVWPHNAQGTPTCTIKVGTTQVAQQACGASPTSIPWNTTAVADGPKTLTVTITDSTTRTGTASVNIAVANTPLTVDITQPTNGSTVSGTNWVVVWPHNPQGTPTCTVKVDGVQVAQQACSASPTSIPWNTTTVTNAAHTLTVTITDSTTRTGTASVNITVSNTPLTVDITQPTNGSTVSGTNWVIVWPHNAQGTPTCTIKVGSTQVAQQACGSSPTSIPWNSTAFVNGNYTLTVTITDSTPRTGTASVSITVSN